jgi:hypothetical protein
VDTTTGSLNALINPLGTSIFGSRLPVSSEVKSNYPSSKMSKLPVKRVAVIGAGPAGAIAIDALAQEKAFDLIRVFERREGPGGCWSVLPLPIP